MSLISIEILDSDGTQNTLVLSAVGVKRKSDGKAGLFLFFLASFRMAGERLRYDKRSPHNKRNSAKQQPTHEGGRMA